LWSHGSLNDVWAFEDAGATRNSNSTHAAWIGSYGFAAVALSDSVFFLMGGYDQSSLLNNIWASHNSGAIWSEVCIAAL
jgi:hypothetical protein